MMKRMKNTVALMMALMMVFSLTVTAFAADEMGSITIDGVSEGVTYEIYRMLDLESYDVVNNKYSYKVNSAWTGFFNTDTAKQYFTVEAGTLFVEAKEAYTQAAAEGFAQAALAYAKTNGITPVRSSGNSGEFEITGDDGKFSDLELGYYLIDSSVGALCGLTTTNPDAAINAKNGRPTVEKQVVEDSTNSPTGTNTADIGQIVDYRTTINVSAGAENFVLHDAMSDGLTFIHDLNDKNLTTNGRGVHKVELIHGGRYSTVDPANYTVTEDPKCEHTGANTDKVCDFTVAFTDEFCAGLEANDKIVVHYNAMLNRHAVIAEDGNPNETWLDFGEDNFTETSTTRTYTFGFDIVKTDGQNTLIDGAKFRIYDAETGGNEIAVVPLLAADDTTPVLDKNGNPKYRRARADETGVEIDVKGGFVEIVGFDNGTYYLEETAAPAGYNKLAARQKFIINGDSLDATFHGEIYSAGTGVWVVNKSGGMLPETGGMGTTLFITIGAIAVLGTGVLLVTKKRMGMIQD